MGATEGEDLFACDDEVVDDLDLESGGSFEEGLGEALVGVRGGSASVRVVVGENEGEGRTAEGVGHDLPRVDESAVDGARFEAFDTVAEKAVGRIEVADLEDFVGQAAETTAPEGFQLACRIERFGGLFDALLQIERGGFPDDAQGDRCN